MKGCMMFLNMLMGYALSVDKQPPGFSHKEAQLPPIFFYMFPCGFPVSGPRNFMIPVVKKARIIKKQEIPVFETNVIKRRVSEICKKLNKKSRRSSCEEFTFKQEIHIKKKQEIPVFKVNTLERRVSEEKIKKSHPLRRDSCENFTFKNDTAVNEFEILEIVPQEAQQQQQSLVSQLVSIPQKLYNFFK